MTPAPSQRRAEGEREGVPGIDYLDDSADEALATIPALRKPCKACPYIEGTAANRDPVTGPIFKECVSSRHAFFCHRTAGAQAARRGSAISTEFPTHLCGGWVKAIRP